MTENWTNLTNTIQSIFFTKMEDETNVKIKLQIAWWKSK